MSEHGDSLSHDEKANAETVAVVGVEASKSVEYPRHILIGNTNSRVENVNADAILEMTAPEKDLSARFCIFYCIAEQIAKNRTEKKGVAHHPRSGRYQANSNPFLKGCPFILPVGFLQQRPQIDWR
jgi:hypothetical protein